MGSVVHLVRQPCNQNKQVLHELAFNITGPLWWASVRLLKQRAGDAKFLCYILPRTPCFTDRPIAGALRERNTHMASVMWYRWMHTVKAWKGSVLTHLEINYHQTSNISGTKSQDLNVSRLALQLFLRNLLRPSVKSRMKITLEQSRQAMLQLHMSVKQVYYPLRCAFYRRFDGTVSMLTNIRFRSWSHCFSNNIWCF